MRSVLAVDSPSHSVIGDDVAISDSNESQGIVDVSTQIR